MCNMNHVNRINIDNGRIYLHGNGLSNEFWRIERLVKAYNLIPKEHQNKFVFMDDHEGHLSVCIDSNILDNEIVDFIRKAWVDQQEWAFSVIAYKKEEVTLFDEEFEEEPSLLDFSS
jgi:ABC-type phosphonate transport system ATPase subunit